MKKFWVILLLFLLAVEFSFAQQEVTTADRKKIILNNDGTWKSVPVESSANLHPVSVHNLELPKANPQSQIIHHTGYNCESDLREF
ncbi:hypothetical protein D4R20_01355 [bacterium]|nr:MAG: hypothetical protein D4R20_01355 [bacterium]